MASMAEFNVSNFPVVIITSNPVEPTDAMLDENLARIEDVLTNTSEKVVLIFDMNKAKMLSSDHRIKAGHWYKKNKHLFDTKSHGIAIVNTSIIVNMMLKGIFLITGNNIATMFTKQEAALSWAKELTGKKSPV